MPNYFMVNNITGGWHEKEIEGYVLALLLSFTIQLMHYSNYVTNLPLWLHCV